MTITSRQSGLSELRDQTKWLIEDDPTTIALIPKAAPVRKPSGGYDYIYDKDNPSVPKPEQTFKIIPTGGGWSNTVVETDSGFSTRSDYVIVGTFDADIDAGDYWVDGNTTYTVNDIIAKNDYEVKANVTAFGTDLNYG